MHVIFSEMSRVGQRAIFCSRSRIPLSTVPSFCYMSVGWRLPNPLQFEFPPLNTYLRRKLTVTGGTIHFTFSDFSHIWLLPRPAYFSPLTCIEILSRVLSDSNDIMVGQESLLFHGEKLSVTGGKDFRQIFGTWTFI